MSNEELFERLVLALEKMTDAQDDMWQEEQYANYRFRDKIREEQFMPARKEFKEAFDQYVDNRIERWLLKNPRKASQMLDGMFGK
jgi:hypothetical protein